MTDIVIPADLWEDEEAEGVITAWLFENGERVDEGTVVAEVMVEKVSYELASPAAGALKILVEAEQPLKPGLVVGKVE